MAGIDMVACFGEGNSVRYSPSRLSNLIIPACDKSALAEIGVPHAVQPYFIADDTAIAPSRLSKDYLISGDHEPVFWQDYYRFGGNDVTSICIKKGEGAVWSVNRFGGDPIFVNSSVECLIEFLCVVCQHRAVFAKSDDETRMRNALVVEDILAEIDAMALSSDNYYWSEIVEEMKSGLQ